MPAYDTITKVVGDVTVTLSKAKSANAGDRLVAFLEWLSEKIVDPGYGKPEGGRPDQGLPPSSGRPDQGLPGTPGAPPRPDQGLPGGGRPDNSLPGQPPRPDNTLPGAGGRPDNTLPGGQPGIDNSLPGLIGENAREIAKAILKGTACDMDKPQPK